LIVVDKDKLEKSNLNRVRGAAVRDVTKNKARILKEFIEYLELPVSVTAIETSIDDDPHALDALASCDVIFGCTDDQIGREVLNASLYVYAQAYIDVGLGGRISNDKNDHPCLRYHFGRVSTILPEYGECLFCQDVIRDDRIQHQYALRCNPTMSEQEARERYLVGGGEHAPGVGPFTSAVADHGVANLFNLLRTYRRYPPHIRSDMYVIDFVTMEFSSRQNKNDMDCPYCKKREYLLMNERCRLNRPALGKPNVAI